MTDAQAPHAGAAQARSPPAHPEIPRSSAVIGPSPKRGVQTPLYPADSIDSKSAKSPSQDTMGCEPMVTSFGGSLIRYIRLEFINGWWPAELSDLIQGAK